MAGRNRGDAQHTLTRLIQERQDRLCRLRVGTRGRPHVRELREAHEAIEAVRQEIIDLEIALMACIAVASLAKATKF